MCAVRWPSRSVCLWQHGFVYHPQARLLGLRPNEQSQTGSSLRFHFWKSSRSSIRKQSRYPNLCRVLEPRVCKIQKKPSQFRPAEVIIQCEAARQARPQTNLCWYPSLIWSDALFVWMSHHPLSLKENPWSWPVPRLETHVQVFLDQCWCGAAELDFVLPSVSVVSWF